MSFSGATYGAAMGEIAKVASGYDHATKTGDNTFDIYFKDGSKVSLTIPQPEIDYDKVIDNVDEFIIGYLEEHKEDFKGEDGKTVQVIESDDEPIQDEAVLIFNPNEMLGEDGYTKTQADVKFAKTYEVGDTSKLVVQTWADLVTAINQTWNAGMGGYNFVVDETQKTLTIITKGGMQVPIDISEIILNTNIEEFKDMLVTNITDGQSLVWSASRKKWINKSIDSSGMLVEAKAYTDEEIRKFNNKGSIACDEKPTYYGGVITYKKGGETKTTEEAGTWFYYFDDNNKVVQTIFVEGTEFTIAMAGDVNLDDYVPKSSLTSVYDSTFTDKSKVPTTAYAEEMRAEMQTLMADKVNVDDIVDNLNSSASDDVLSARMGKKLNDDKFDKVDVVSDFTENPTDLNKVPNLNWISGLRNVILTALGKKADKTEVESVDEKADKNAEDIAKNAEDISALNDSLVDNPNLQFRGTANVGSKVENIFNYIKSNPNLKEGKLSFFNTVKVDDTSKQDDVFKESALTILYNVGNSSGEWWGFILALTDNDKQCGAIATVRKGVVSKWRYLQSDSVTTVPVNKTLTEIDGGNTPALLTLPTVPIKYVKVFTTIGMFLFEGREGLEFEFKQTFVTGVQTYGAEMRIGVNWNNGIVHYGLISKGEDASYPTIQRIEYM